LKQCSQRDGYQEPTDSIIGAVYQDGRI
jgi:dsRNA-specific ribonuclease